MGSRRPEGLLRNVGQFRPIGPPKVLATQQHVAALLLEQPLVLTVPVPRPHQLLSRPLQEPVNQPTKTQSGTTRLHRQCLKDAT